MRSWLIHTTIHITYPTYHLQWPADGQASASSFPNKSGVNSPTQEGLNAGLACAGNPNCSTMCQNWMTVERVLSVQQDLQSF